VRCADGYQTKEERDNPELLRSSWRRRRQHRCEDLSAGQILLELTDQALVDGARTARRRSVAVTCGSGIARRGCRSGRKLSGVISVSVYGFRCRAVREKQEQGKAQPARRRRVSSECYY
jgi:hypothetical protein